jgi:hypothetical protein
MPPDETTTEEKSSRSYWGFVLWPVAVVVTEGGSSLLRVSRAVNVGA